MMEWNYSHIFGTENDEGMMRYWLSVSTEKLDKKGNPSGEFARANISVRLSKKAAEVFQDCATKTKNKNVKMANVSIKDAFLKAVEPREGEPFVILFVNVIEPEDD